MKYLPPSHSVCRIVRFNGGHLQPRRNLIARQPPRWQEFSRVYTHTLAIAFFLFPIRWFFYHDHAFSRGEQPQSYCTIKRRETRRPSVKYSRMRASIREHLGVSDPLSNLKHQWGILKVPHCTGYCPLMLDTVARRKSRCTRTDSVHSAVIGEWIFFIHKRSCRNRYSSCQINGRRVSFDDVAVESRPASVMTLSVHSTDVTLFPVHLSPFCRGLYI